MLRSYVGQHQSRKLQLFIVFLEIFTPLDIIHILKKNLALLGSNEVILHIIDIPIVFLCLGDINLGIVIVDTLYRGFDEFLHSLKGKTERVDRTLKSLEHQYAHQSADTHLSTLHGKVAFLPLAEVLLVFAKLAWENKRRWGVYRKI